MKKIILATLAIALCVSLAPLPADAYRGRKMAEDHPAMMTALIARLNLTEQQQQEFRSLQEAHQNDSAPLMLALKNKRAELRVLWLQPDSDSAAIKAKETEIHALNWQLREKRTELRLALRNILTPEQLTRFMAMPGPKSGMGPACNSETSDCPPMCPKRGQGMRRPL